MRTILRNLLVLCAVALTASAASEENVTRQLDVAPGDKLSVDVDFGSIDVSAGADGKVALEAHRKIDFGNETKEKEYLADVPITITKEGNVVTIRSRGKKVNNWNIFHCTTDASYIVHVPKKFEVGLRTDGGMIVVRDITGNVNAHTSGGRMAFARLEGTLDGETSGGAIEAEDCRGPIGIETSGGHIKVAGGQGSLKAHTSGGRIEVHNFSGDTEVRTSGGSLDFEKISGKIVGKTSGGGIRVWLPELLGDVKLETSAGSIDLAVPTSAAFTIDANTSVGGVESRLPFQELDAGREHLHGTLNGGGKSIRLATSAGKITIQPAAGERVNR
ncbi:MAG TPA: DUF4097 family beta strand repeat-containing protein [Chthoniobacterales bacterium]|jgi:hypothetical protein|nr:DUF4097 family beta strand repeat-containing protein [Chthoniobacterales bacterium]